MEDQDGAKAKLMKILEQDEPAVEAKEGPELTEEQRALLAKIMAAPMPTPEEIAEAAAINEHNAKISLRRQENLTRREQRRSLRVKKRKRK